MVRTLLVVGLLAAASAGSTSWNDVNDATKICRDTKVCQQSGNTWCTKAKAKERCLADARCAGVYDISKSKNRWRLCTSARLKGAGERGHGVLLLTRAATTTTTAKPCMMVDCAPGFRLDGADKRGCGGKCFKKVCACTKMYKPVLCSGKTYDNQCEADCEDATGCSAVTTTTTTTQAPMPSTEGANKLCSHTTCSKVDHVCDTHKAYMSCTGAAFRCSWATKFKRLASVRKNDPCSTGQEVTSIKVHHHNGPHADEECTQNGEYKCGMGLLTADSSKCECVTRTDQNAHSLDNYEVGSVAVDYAWTGRKCQRFEFKNAFAVAPRIVITPTHRGSSHDHNSISVWTELADTDGFLACFRDLSANDAHDSHMTIDYFAWVGETVGRAVASTVDADSLKAGVRCKQHAFPKAFATTPFVVGSVDHTGAKSATHDAISSWLEGITRTGFKVCFSESAHNGYGAHSDAKFHFLAFVPGQFSATDASGRSTALVGAESRAAGGTCHWIPYSRHFSEPPMVVATLNHHSTAASSKHKAVNTWVEAVETTRFRFCANPLKGTHTDTAYVDWVAIKERSLSYEAGSQVIGGFEGKQCASFQFKKRFADVPRITVMASHRTEPGSTEHDSVALWTEWVSRDGYRACWQEVNADKKHKHLSLEYFAWVGDRLGAAHAGTIDAGSITKANKCLTHKFEEPFATKPMVVGSIDHTGYKGADDHDALTSWVEGITTAQFRVCFADTDDYTTSGATGVKYHFVAFNQGAFPAADAHGRTARLAGGAQITMKNNCKWVQFGKVFTYAPVVFASLNHHNVGPTDTHDGAIVWVENVGNSRFKLCMREMKEHGGKNWQHTGDLWADWFAVSNYDL